jgi:peptide/nickel transport system permease protein
MQGFIISRLAQAIITLLILSLAVFLSVNITGDTAAYMIGPDQGRLEYEQVRAQLGLDRPLIVRYGDFLTDLLRVDFGVSHFLERPARELLFERLPATLQLAGAAFALSVIIGVPLGVISAVKRDTFVDTFAKFFATLGIATPSFWIAIMLIMLFGAKLGWLPTYGRGGLDHFILPAFVLGWGSMAGMVRLGRSSMLEVLDSEYVKFARIKGLPEKIVIYKHALKNVWGADPGRTAQRLSSGRSGLRLAGHWPADAPGHSDPGLCHYPGHGAGCRVLVHCHRPACRYSVRLFKPENPVRLIDERRSKLLFRRPSFAV